jgi:transposase-like protein
MKHKSEDYKYTAVQYYLVEDKTQVEVCKIFHCSPRSLMRWVKQYKKTGNVNINYRKPIAYKVKKGRGRRGNVVSLPYNKIELLLIVYSRYNQNKQQPNQNNKTCYQNSLQQM